MIAVAVQASPAYNMKSSACEEKRQQVLGRLLSDRGEKCSSVDRTFYQGSDKKGNAF